MSTVLNSTQQLDNAKFCDKISKSYFLTGHRGGYLKVEHLENVVASGRVCCILPSTEDPIEEKLQAKTGSKSDR